jgi:branched-chain amino acid transport system permease protein
MVLTPLLLQGRAIGTGGSKGLGSIPSIEVLGQPLGMFGWYYAAFGISLAMLYIIYRIINSSIGLAFVSLRDTPAAANSLGEDEYRYKLMVFGISAFITGLMGGFYANYIGVISPTILGTDIFIMVIAMMLFGGLGKFPGAVFGAYTITVINELLRPVGSFRQLILGAIIVATLIYMPQGLIGLLGSSGNLMSRAKNWRSKMRHKETL